MNTIKSYMMFILIFLSVCTIPRELYCENNNNEGPAYVTTNETGEGITTFLPKNPVTAIENSEYQFTTTPSKLSGSTIVTPGGEQWYEITPSSETTIVKVTPDPENHAMFMLYNSAGYPCGSALSIDYENYKPGITAEYLAVTVPGQVYYICILPITTNNKPEATVTMMYYPGPTDVDEENDSFEQALPLAGGTPVEGLNLDNDYFVFEVDEQGSTGVEIEIHMVQSPGFVISLYLYTTGHNLVDSREYIDSDVIVQTTLDAGGIYYLCIYPESWGKNAHYSIEWRYE